VDKDMLVGVDVAFADAHANTVRGLKTLAEGLRFQAATVEALAAVADRLQAQDTMLAEMVAASPADADRLRGMREGYWNASIIVREAAAELVGKGGER